jgi:hypothetical protein
MYLFRYTRPLDSKHPKLNSPNGLNFVFLGKYRRDISSRDRFMYTVPRPSLPSFPSSVRTNLEVRPATQTERESMLGGDEDEDEDEDESDEEEGGQTTKKDAGKSHPPTSTSIA